jgi:hypothetical protein
MEDSVLNTILEISEEFFHTKDDPTQIPTTMEASKKILDLYPGAFSYKMENGTPVSWVIVIPTQKEIAEKFLRGELNERELLENTKKEDVYDALYLQIAFTLPEFRGKGFPICLFKKAIAKAPISNDAMFFAWAYSKEGKALIQKTSAVLQKKIHIKV